MKETRKTPTQWIAALIGGMKKEYKVAFLATFIMGLLIHMPVMLMDVPNHDGLGSMYFDQNMITSGRWFLTIACGFSSYYTIPWVIGLFGVLLLSLTAVCLVAQLEVEDPVFAGLIGGLLISFPALASTFAYVFTMDGYMMGLLLAVLAVYSTKRFKKGFVLGALCLAFSMGTYQSYLPFAILLCVYQVLLICMQEESLKEKIGNILHYLYMGVLGVIAYYVILRVLLLIQGKELASYQGINGMDGAKTLGIDTITFMYRDFISFTLKGNILFQNIFSLAGCILLAAAFVYVGVQLMISRKWWKSIWFFVIIAMTVAVLPLATNVILFISPNVTYHLLMRYQWVVYLILMVAFVERFGTKQVSGNLLSWLTCGACVVLVFHYAVTDNIGYSNLQKRYEKTYAYCVRLLDRIEQTPGFDREMPIAMVGVVGYNPFPVTDITLPVTSNMIGLNGDTLLYTGENYEVFMRNYLGASLNMMTPEEMGDIYFSEEYIEMESFPAPSSVKIVDGVMYVKTENVGRD